MSDFEQLIQQDKPTLVDFFATWCGPCRVQGPILEEVKKKVGDTANILKVDIDRTAVSPQHTTCAPCQLSSSSKTVKPCGAQ